ncbi:MAG: UDP-N-acetylmuramate dehydrogenase [SAR324 cluster bacterium]|nr:UDP-N-acetylmuramate dehydrogenase [SAR324 cluster bacterium]
MDLPKKYQSLIEAKWIVPPILNVSLSSYTSFRCNSRAELLLTLSNQNELRQFLQISTKKSWIWIILGRGSNCIFTDQGLAGILVSLRGDFKKIVCDQKSQTLDCGSAALNFAVFREAKKLSWQGGEFLSTIPGTIGGGIAMNAGAYGREFKDIILEVGFWDLDDGAQIFDNMDCQFTYRGSIFHKKKIIITRAILKFDEGDFAEIDRNQAKFLHHRKTKQPIHSATWGSVFMNPKNNSAGSLIEQCGLKGKGFGNAKISEKHANFIENTGLASFQDAKLTILMAKDRVYKKFGISLNLEVIIIGKYGKVISVDKLDDVI